MKVIRLIFTVTLLFCSGIVSAQTGRTWTEKYNVEEYTIKETEYRYAITNKKYDLVISMAVDYLLDGESIWNYQKMPERIRKGNIRLYHLAKEPFFIVKSKVF